MGGFHLRQSLLCEVKSKGEIIFDDESLVNDDGDDSQGWAYNVWNITNSEAAVYTFNLDGERMLFSSSEILIQILCQALLIHFVLFHIFSCHHIYFCFDEKETATGVRVDKHNFKGGWSSYRSISHRIRSMI